jgi:transposase
VVRKLLADLLKRQKSVGQTSRLTPETVAGLLQAMRVGDIATFYDARDYLEREWGIRYYEWQASVVALQTASGYVNGGASTEPTS